MTIVCTQLGASDCGTRAQLALVVVAVAVDFVIIIVGHVEHERLPVFFCSCLCASYASGRPTFAHARLLSFSI